MKILGPVNFAAERIGRRAAVTGAAAGIGAARAMALARHGVRMACVDSVSPDRTMASIAAGAGRAPDIPVDAICPGSMDSAIPAADPMTVEWRQQEEDIPLGRFGAAEEIADMAVFLAMNSSRFITGQGMNVKGGRMMP